jgi:hypothetical protein
VLVASAQIQAAPKQSVLEPLFAKSGYSSAKPEFDDKGNVTYRIKISDSITVNVQELTTGYGWVWAVVTQYDAAPPLRIYRKIAEINDGSRLGALSAGPRSDQKPGSGVFINYFFLMRTADAAALQDYIDKIALDCEEFGAKLNEP